MLSLCYFYSDGSDGDASHIIGVDFLFEPDVLVELEAYAVLD